MYLFELGHCDNFSLMNLEVECFKRVLAFGSILSF